MIDYEYRTGGVTQEPELRHTNNGTPVLRLRLAQSSHTYNEETRDWDRTAAHYFSVIVWPQRRGDRTIDLPTFLADTLQVGQKVAVKGQYKTRSYTDKEGRDRNLTEFIASEVYLDAATMAEQADEGSAPQQSQAGFGSHADGEPPF